MKQRLWPVLCLHGVLLSAIWLAVLANLATAPVDSPVRVLARSMQNRIKAFYRSSWSAIAKLIIESSEYSIQHDLCFIAHACGTEVQTKARLRTTCLTAICNDRRQQRNEDVYGCKIYAVRNGVARERLTKRSSNVMKNWKRNC